MLNTDRGSHFGARLEKRAAAGAATPNTGRGSHRGPIRRCRGTPWRNSLAGSTCGKKKNSLDIFHDGPCAAWGEEIREVVKALALLTLLELEQKKREPR
ncbi:hypothetical protein NDU88_004296 [Pleurodeles waltl]|uniref:Uncharacterized protein n=1 Tax=Pleurodeles waltl TaxID=8319 RepID=A0AAV7QI02_PLEWA|nr:hypothetical protein NDU88_004296 [Pleurodeles waltl]